MLFYSATLQTDGSCSLPHSYANARFPVILDELECIGCCQTSHSVFLLCFHPILKAHMPAPVPLPAPRSFWGSFKGSIQKYWYSDTYCLRIRPFLQLWFRVNWHFWWRQMNFRTPLVYLVTPFEWMKPEGRRLGVYWELITEDSFLFLLTVLEFFSFSFFLF